ncbi:hypothetical protein N5D61_02935 [Pseudomonas sp. GD03842]|uniref:hypothetical protein n=1 Tax=Pseudomonas sp. GD03842 TaxID=2975385 RepID=UPI00244739F2|nr:hypothetical protein [Pseudomonas sp. GD03842]MDH0745299.1 hypothetical protein [Pseudomonas sp. GD03842]
MSRELFPYLLITNYPEVGSICGAVAEGGVYQHNDSQLYSFLTTKSLEILKKEFSTAGKEFVLVMADHFAYAHADGRLARVFHHLS